MKKIPYILIVLLYLTILFKIGELKFKDTSKYIALYEQKSSSIVLGNTAKRGRILDTNGKVLVDNKAIYNINYRKNKNSSLEEEKKLAFNLTKELNLDKEASVNELKNFYLLDNDTSYLLSEEEKELYTYRKLSEKEVMELKYNRLQDEILNYSLEEKKMIHTYYLMNTGYSFDTKKIKEDVSVEECAKITELSYKGVTCDITWFRDVKYPYIESILGNVGKIPEEKQDYYLSNGYDRDDIVGISGLEEYYDDLLKGEKAEYQVEDDNNLKLVKEEVTGKDLVLSLDIDIENKVYEVMKKELLHAEKYSSTLYYNHSYVIVSKPNTGEIVALLGLQKNKVHNDITFMDISSKAMLSSYPVGSLVKGASHTVGYQNNLIDVGKKINDSCVKLYLVPQKCSFKRLGYIDDITALKMSSNYYQFITAIKSTGNNYYPEIKIDVDEDNFNKYRDVFKKYGLGSSTGIDFPKEETGIKGQKIAIDLLLNLAIGQYDTYTPVQIAAYINTIATSGTRKALSFKKQDNNVLDTVGLDEYYMKRIQRGFYEVINGSGGTGNGYTETKFFPAGKTGTAQTFYNGVNTLNMSYIMYAPYENPRYSLVVISPNLFYDDGKSEYMAPMTRIMGREISEYLFTNY